jgi:hypothetical protein
MRTAINKALATAIVALAVGSAPGAFVEPASAGNMGDTSAAMRANAAAYPEFFAPESANSPDPAYRPTRNRACRVPLGENVDSRCRPQ